MEIGKYLTHCTTVTNCYCYSKNNDDATPVTFHKSSCIAFSLNIFFGFRPVLHTQDAKLLSFIWLRHKENSRCCH